MLSFSRRRPLRRQHLPLNQTLDEVAGLLRANLDPRIRLVLHKGEPLWPVLADPAHVTQVVMNLCLNARDALQPLLGCCLPDRPGIEIETANVMLSDADVRRSIEARPGEFVRLRVTDTGSGIAPEEMAHIFEPFFTTKGPGRGSGLGLAMAFGIVTDLGGWMTCRSELGQGTEFDVFLPRCSVRGDEAPPTFSAAHGSETVLLAEDDPIIRNLGRSILTRYGYRVLLAEHGAEAVETFRRAERRVDLVILDTTMPRLSGPDAFWQLLRIDPHVRVLFASGYGEDQVLPARHENVLGFVGKPYRPEELAQRVRAALDQARNRLAGNGDGAEVVF